MGSYAVVLHTNKLYSNREQYEELVKGTEPYGYVYAWENLWNWNMYVGQTIDLDEREKQHISRHKQAIDQAIDKYGEENFDRYIIDVAYSKEELDEREKYWIAYYDTFKGEGYNCTEGGSNGKHSEETKKKLSEAKKGEKNPAKNPKVRAKLSEVLKGVPKSDTHKKAMSEAKKNKTGEKCNSFKGYILVTNAKTSEFIGVFAGMCEIARELKSTEGKKLYPTNISNVLTGKLKSYGGYFYTRLTDNEYKAYVQSQAS